MLSDFYANGDINKDDIAKTIEIVLKGDTESDAKIESAKTMKIATEAGTNRTQAQADANKAKLGDARVFENAVITSTGCIASYKLTKVDDTTVELSGIMINSKGNYKVDVSAAFAN